MPAHRAGARRLALLVLPQGPAPAWGDPVTGASSYTAGGVTWRVAWTVSDSVYGPLARVTGLTRSGDSGTSDGGGLRWDLRWDNLPDRWPPSTPPAVPFQHVTGTLCGTSGVGDRPVATYLSPRLVAPDGGCQVYLSPYANAHGQPGLPRVAVLGDSLLQQLNDAAYPELVHHHPPVTVGRPIRRSPRAGSFTVTAGRLTRPRGGGSVTRRGRA
ncbi:hypothetical protein [Nonomuraea rubra]|uniref:hypothetical protein n=1 Tax=Nonomuraea rubra TaxID=46180 RepID=UPI0033FA4586